MIVNTDYKIVTKEEFHNEYSKLKSVISGKGRDVAFKAGVDYFKFRNAINGRISNPAVLGGILRAC